MTEQDPKKAAPDRPDDGASPQADDKQHRMGRPSRWLIGLGFVAAIAAGVGYALLTAPERELAAQCAASQARLAAVKPLATGEVAALIVPSAPENLNDLAFNGPNGQAMTIADFAGRVVLLNLWATWCAPCREEMPALDRLQGTLGSADFEVVAINVDTRDAAKAPAFLQEIGVADLKTYADNTMRIFQDLRKRGRAFGMPTTVLIDANGCELGTMSGPAEWDSEDALKLITAALAVDSN